MDWLWAVYRLPGRYTLVTDEWATNRPEAFSIFSFARRNF